MKGGKRPGAGRPIGAKAKISKQATIPVRVPVKLRAALELAAARRRKPSLSAEILDRLNSSLAFQNQIDNFIRYFGGRQEFALMSVIASVMHTADYLSEKKWVDDPYRFDVAVKLANEMLERFRPDGDIIRPPRGFLGHPNSLGNDDQQIQGFVAGKVSEIVHAPDDEVNGRPNASGGTDYFSDEMLNAPRIRRWLGPLVSRLQKSRPQLPKRRK